MLKVVLKGVVISPGFQSAKGIDEENANNLLFITLKEINLDMYKSG